MKAAGLRARVRRAAHGMRDRVRPVPAPMAVCALEWVRTNHLPAGGIRVQSGHAHAYPEVTGYLIPTLLAYGERDLAAELCEWLLCIQRPDGSFTDPDEGRSYVFDSGQVLRGLLAAVDLVPGAEEGARRAAAFLRGRLEASGRYPDAYAGTDCPEAVHLYVLPPLRDAGLALGLPECADAAYRCLDAYIASGDFGRLGDLTHFLGYELEALIAMERADLARPVLAALARTQRPDGGVPGRGGVDWVCSTGVAQLAICWYLLGDDAPADAAMRWIETTQERDGGFRGSYGSGAAYKQDVEISWAVKFALDAHLLRVRRFFARHEPTFPAAVDPADGRLQAILAHVSDGDRVLEVGCGKGRFLHAVGAARRVELHGVDPAPSLLAGASAFASIRDGSLERIPHPDAAFDVVFSVEALEHSNAWERSIDELVRVVRPGGWIVIVDKHAGAWGRMSCPSWERWPEIAGIVRLLRRHCDEVTAVNVAYDGRPATDGLMVAWAGRRRTRLSGDDWNAVLGVAELEREIVEDVRFGRFSEWGRAVMRHTRPAQRVLEIGSGTAKISLQLAIAGRRVTCLDSSRDSLAFAVRCAARLGVPLDTVCADATGRLPFADRQFDCVWSSGLLEHFDADERRLMLHEWARVCRGLMVHLVPNAAAVAYRVGKAVQEREGTWPYGLEMPLPTLRDDFAAAGIAVTAEFTVAPRHGLNFVGDAAVRRQLARVMDAVSTAELDGWRQGYLLVTVGRVAPR